MLLTIKDLSTWLNIKPSTLYLWAAQGKIPCQKIHGLIRFDPEKVLALAGVIRSKAADTVMSFSRNRRNDKQADIDRLIEAAKRDAYTPRGETIPTASPKGKEEDDGAR